MRENLLIANWKMNGSLGFNKKFFLQLKESLESKNNNISIAICPPDIYISNVRNLIDENMSFLSLGTQNVSSKENGAYTGQISLKMLEDYKVQQAIIGHSERRAYNYETDADIAEKVVNILQNSNDMTPVLCVGESLEQRDVGNTYNVISSQVNTVLQALDAANVLHNNEVMSRLVIAYEPIWAIGTGKVATANIADEVCSFIRGLIAKISLELSDKVRIIYGGSVKSNNSLELISQPNIDGFLVGGASLDAAEFVKIYQHMCN